MTTTEREAILSLFQHRGAIRARDLKELGVSRQALLRLHRSGAVERPSRGLYVLSSVDATEHHSLVEATKVVPKGVVCLLSSLRFHGLTTQAPFEIWIAIAGKAWSPAATSPALRIVRFSGPALRFGIEKHRIEGVEVSVYSPAKTVADCFKFRHKIGLDVALEALRDCRKQRKATLDELWASAKVCRMSNVMRPYLEAIA